jgi:23S rRNA pseudouridine955/2504/2580 synthase
VHLESIGLPLFGDKLYGKKDHEFLCFLKQVKFVTELPYSPHCLHASSLEFHHPVTGVLLKVEADMPQVFKAVLKNFQP